MLKAAGFMVIAAIVGMIALANAASIHDATMRYFAHGMLGLIFALAYWKWMPLGIHETHVPTPQEKRPALAVLILPGIALAIGLLVYGVVFGDAFAIFLGTSFLVTSILWIASVLTDREVI